MKFLRRAAVVALGMPLAFCSSGAPAFAAVPTNTVEACRQVPLPGTENTLNPHDPPNRRVQATVMGDCVAVTFPDPTHQFDRSRITDFLHDVRTIA